MRQIINDIKESQREPVNVFYVKTDGINLVAASDNTSTSFVGIAKNEDFYRCFNDEQVNLLIDAVNNRTRERNYFRLLSKYLSEEISDAEFEKEIEDNERLYVIDASKVPTQSQLMVAAELSKRIIDIESADDFLSLFSFSEPDSETIRLLGAGE